jgi:chromosome segregation ATPase
MTQYIPWIISGIATLFAILTYARTGHKDEMKDRAEQTAKLEGLTEALIKANIKLDQLCAMMTETRQDIKSLNKVQTELDKRLSVVEKSLETAFNKIDELREEVKAYGVD